MKAVTLTSTALTIALVTLMGAKTSATSCPPIPLNRPLEWLHQEWNRQHSMAIDHDSAFMTPSFRNYLIATNLLTATGEEYYRALEQSCPTQPSSGPDVEGRSLCPWYYIYNVDEDRFPETLTEARCRCDECLDNAMVPCERINYNLLVLRKNTTVCDGDYYTYDVGYQSIGVGCTCAVPAAA